MRTTMSLAKACVLQGAAFVLWASLLLARSTASVVLRRQDGGFKGAGTRMQYLTKYLSEHRGAFESQLSEAQAQQPVIAQEATAADENADTEYTMTQAAKFYDITKQLQAQSVVAMQELLQVTDALLKVVGVNGNGQQCGNVKCGLHAVCTQTTQGAQCLCQPGYFGDGLKCSEPPTYLPKKLLTDGLNGLDERVLDLSMIPLGADRILVVYRNADRNNRGYLLLGTIRGTILEWGTPEMFSVNDKKEKVQAWDPSVVAAPGADGTNGKIVIAFRSAQADGDCLAVSADIDDSMGRGFMEWSPTVKFCEQQANSRIVGQLFPEENSYIAMFNRRSAAEGTFSGAALTFDLERFKMTPSTADPVQFSDTAVSDLRTARMSSTGFLLEFSRAPREDEENGGTVQQDAVVTYGMVEEGALTFLPAAISAFPKDMKKILTRDLASLSGKIACLGLGVSSSGVSVFKTLEVNPKAKTEPKLKWISTRQLQRPGQVPFVSLVNSKQDEPLLMAFYAPEGEEQSFVEFCPIDLTSGSVDVAQCREKPVPGVDGRMKELQAIDVGGGKLVVTFTTEKSNAAYYMLFGVF